MDTVSIVEGLWENGRDSIVHALDHFSERDRERSDRQHHDKWIVLSVLSYFYTGKTNKTSTPHNRRQFGPPNYP